MFEAVYVELEFFMLEKIVVRGYDTLETPGPLFSFCSLFWLF
jgi:hypothetical protein